MQPLPLTIRDTAPGPDYVRLTGARADGLPDGIHTGGAWLAPDGQTVWKPLDGRPHANTDHHWPTRESECLLAAQGLPFFPSNWRIEEANGRRFLVRPRASILTPQDAGNLMERDQVEELIISLRLLNGRGWAVNDFITLGIDPDDQWFIVDLSAAWEAGDGADDDWRLMQYLEMAGHTRRVKLYHDARHVLCQTCWLLKPETRGYRHVYASRHRPMDAMWARLEGVLYQDADYALTGVQTWAISQTPLVPDLLKRYELEWAWSPRTSDPRFHDAAQPAAAGQGG
jgi:hypothetical protein